MTTRPEAFRFFEPLRVRWCEVDAQQIVFNGHYLAYVDTAITGYWRALAAPYASTMARLGGDLVVRKATLDYRASARFEDALRIGVRCARVGNTSIVFEAAVFRREQLLVLGELVYVCVDAGRVASQPVPPALRQALEDFEAGRPVIEVRLGDWASLGELAHPVRKAVFVDEQGIPAAMEWDVADQTALHAVVVNRFGEGLATGRLVETSPGVGKVGRMAVQSSLRGQALGRMVLDALVEAARRRGDREVMLQAQVSAEPFYLRAGFVRRGPRFEEVGIPHQEMVLPLRELAA